MLFRQLLKEIIKGIFEAQVGRGNVLSTQLFEKYKDMGHMFIINDTLYVSPLFIAALAGARRGRGAYELTTEPDELSPSDVQLDFSDERNVLATIKKHIAIKRPVAVKINRPSGQIKAYPVANVERSDDGNINIPAPPKNVNEIDSPNAANIITFIENGEFNSKTKDKPLEYKRLALKRALKFADENNYPPSTLDKIKAQLNEL